MQILLGRLQKLVDIQGEIQVFVEHQQRFLGGENDIGPKCLFRLVERVSQIPPGGLVRLVRPQQPCQFLSADHLGHQDIVEKGVDFRIRQKDRLTIL